MILKTLTAAAALLISIGGAAHAQCAGSAAAERGAMTASLGFPPRPPAPWQVRMDALADARCQAAHDKALAEIATQKAAHATAEANYRQALAKAEAGQEARGYKQIAFDDFALDGRKLAEAGTKVAVSGVYKKIGEMALLFPNAITLLSQHYEAAMPVLIDDTVFRSVRKFLLQCDSDPIGRGCQITLNGTATMCTITNFAGQHDAPCLKVEDGWNVAP